MSAKPRWIPNVVREVVGGLQVMFLYSKAIRLRRSGRLEDARSTVLRCAAMIHEPIESPKGVLVSFVPSLLARLSDELGRWDGEADALRSALAACADLKAADIKPGAWAHYEWMQKRLLWLERFEPGVRSGVH